MDILLCVFYFFAIIIAVLKSRRENEIMQDPYGTIAKYYDALCEARNTSEVRQDTKFYLEETRGLFTGSTILELGAGTLRIGLHIAKGNPIISVIALDQSPAMLKVAQDKLETHPPELLKRVTLVQGDMRVPQDAIGTSQNFPLVIIPFRGFQNLLTFKDQRMCLENIREIINLTNGRLIFDIFDPRFEALSPHPTEDFGTPIRHIATFKDPKTNNMVSVSTTRTNIDRVAQTFTELWIFDEWTSTGKMKRETQELTLRWSYKYEIEHLLELCGFYAKDLFSDFARSPYRYGQHQIWVARPLANFPKTKS